MISDLKFRDFRISFNIDDYGFDRLLTVESLNRLLNKLDTLYVLKEERICDDYTDKGIVSYLRERYFNLELEVSYCDSFLLLGD